MCVFCVSDAFLVIVLMGRGIDYQQLTAFRRLVPCIVYPQCAPAARGWFRSVAKRA